MYFILFCLGFVGFSPPLYLGLNFVVETSPSGDSTPFSLVPDSDLSSVFPVLTPFGWSMLFCARGIDGFGPLGVLTLVIRACKPLEVCDSSCTPFTFEITLCNPFERTGPFIWPISYFCSFTCTINFRV
jgi:hypothetical protein